MSGSTSILDSLTPVGSVAAPPPMAAPSAPSSVSLPGDNGPAPAPQAKSSGTSILDSLQPVASRDSMAIQGGMTEQPSTYRGIAKQIAVAGPQTGANVANILHDPFGNLIGRPLLTLGGAAYDAGAKLTGLYSPMTPEQRASLQGEDEPEQAGTTAVNAVGHALGAPTPDEVPANGPAERLVRKATTAAGTMAALGPGGVVAPLSGAVGAVAGDQAAQAAPDWAKPAAELAGNVAGAGATQLGAGVGSAIAGKAATPGGMAGIGPKEEIGGVKATQTQIQAAGNKVAEAVGPEGRANLNTQPEQLVPGSQPTTAQVAQTPGATALEQAHRTATPVPFQERAAAQNSARLAAVNQLAPEQAQPGAVGAFFQQQLAKLDQEGQRAVQGARAGVTQATDQLGGTLPTEAYGDQIRSSLQTAQEPVTANTRALWQAVDPDGTWALPVTGARDAAQQLLGEISPTAHVDEQEGAILQRAANLPDIAKFSDLGQLRTDINDVNSRLSGAQGFKPNVRRLTILKQSLDQSISDAVDGRAQQEAQAVASGQMAPEQTMGASLQRQAQDWYAARNAQAGASASGGPNRVGSVSNAGGGPSAIPGMGRAGGKAAGGPGNAPGNQSLAPEVPNLTQEHADAYSSAVAATRAEKQQFGQGGVGKVLRPGGRDGDFRVQDGNVPRQIFTRGPTEPAEVERFINAVGGADKAAQIGQETLTNELRQNGIIKPDGTIDANRFATWQARRKDTVSQFPGLADKFANAETAQRTLDDASAAHQTALKEFQTSSAAKFINDDPQKAVGAAFGSSNPTATFAKLVRQVRGNKDAEEGLKRAVVDYILEKTRSATPANSTEDFLKADVFRRWIRQNNGALKELSGGQWMQTLDQVAADLRRQAQPAMATTGSNTADKLAGKAKAGLGLKEGAHLTALAVIGDQLGEAISHAVGGEGLIGHLAGPAVAVGGYLIHSMRQAGINTINDLTREAMLHPQLARELMARADAGKISTTAAQRIARALQATLVTNAAQPQEQKQ